MRDHRANIKGPLAGVVIPAPSSGRRGRHHADKEPESAPDDDAEKHVLAIGCGRHHPHVDVFALPSPVVQVGQVLGLRQGPTFGGGVRRDPASSQLGDAPACRHAEQALLCPCIVGEAAGQFLALITLPVRRQLGQRFGARTIAIASLAPSCLERAVFQQGDRPEAVAATAVRVERRTPHHAGEGTGQ